MGSSIKKSRKRTIQNVNSQVRKPMDYRFYFLIRESFPNSMCNLEYRAAEVAKDLALAKVLKDMFNLLNENKQSNCGDLSTVGIVHSG